MPDHPEKDSLPEPARRGSQHQHSFAHRVAVVYGIGLIFFLVIAIVWMAAEVLLLIYASVLVAILLNAASRSVARGVGIRRSFALAFVLSALFLLLGMAGYFVAPRIINQLAQLLDTIPPAIDTLQQWIRNYPLGRSLLQRLPDPQQILSNAVQALLQAKVLFSGVMGTVLNFFIILFVGTYLAAQPRLYIDGVLKLVPIRKRARGREVFDELGRTLELWLLGKLVSMLTVGIASAVGLMLLDVPLAITLGVIAGLLDFIPYIGPILASVPAILVGFAESPVTGLYVILLFIGLQTAEGYLLLPLVERETVSLPPAVTISMQVMLGLPFGLLGVALATPLAAAAFVLIAMLYVQDMLHDPVRTPSEM